MVFDEWKHRRAASRVHVGDGSALQRFRWWQLPGRALFYLRLDRLEYAVDVRHWQNQSSGEVKANLYRDGRRLAVSKLPAEFPVEDGMIQVAMSGVGMKRCHYLTHDGSEHALTPDPASAEGRRARLDSRHPTVSRAIGVASVLLLLIGVVLLVLQIAEPVSRIPPIADSVGSVTSPIDVPVWLNIALGVGAAVASAERSLRLRYHWLLDAAGN
ncbi:hypothetical protein [Rhodococcoides yunnanense]|uniref:hypothetical protein n=1 Tax=Rhodococcoides yunnanense TaxID=278209 RepID=UPI000933CB6E|nr:hypothetical protein [Rhodococcus yunnanensis]